LLHQVFRMPSSSWTLTSLVSNMKAKPCTNKTPRKLPKLRLSYSELTSFGWLLN
jgi:hypothetical protein